MICDIMRYDVILMKRQDPTLNYSTLPYPKTLFNYRCHTITTISTIATITIISICFLVSHETNVFSSSRLLFFHVISS